MAATELSLHGRREVFHCTEMAACFRTPLQISKATECFCSCVRLLGIVCDVWESSQL